MRLKEKMRQVVLEDLDSLSRDLASLAADESEDKEEARSADVYFQVGGGGEGGDETTSSVRVNGHSAIFSCRCSRWPALLAAAAAAATAAEPAGVLGINMKQVRPDAFRTFKSFVYTGRLEWDQAATKVNGGGGGQQQQQLFEIMGLAAMFGVESLISFCLGQVRNGLTLTTAAEMLNAAVATLDSGGGPESDRILEPVLAFITDNIFILRERRLLLPGLTKAALVALLQFHRLRNQISENEIWRLCSEWGRQQAGIGDIMTSSPRPPPSSHTWTEKERAAMRVALHGVVQHVRLLAIDSAVFAEEVEPTGAVPIELSLERYRQAALHLPEKFASGHNSSSSQLQQQQQLPPLPPQSGGGLSNSRVENARALPAFPRSGDAPLPRLTRPPPPAATSGDLSRLNPRVEADTRPPSGSSSFSHHHHYQQQHQSQQQLARQPARSLFHGSRILASLAAENSSAPAGHYEKLLNSWAGSPAGQAWTLIFRASEHGFSAAAFHRMCDGAAPSYVLVKADTG
jgi:hypothetical protein